MLHIGLLLLFLECLGSSGPAIAQTLNVKLGTLAPEGSPWYKHIRAMGDEWEKVSGGRVKLTIYPGGVSGHEGQILTKIKIGQLHAAVFTATGLIDIDRGPLALQLPMAISTYEELDYVLAELGPTLEKRLLDKGYRVLTWGDAGWVHFFSSTPVTTVAALKDTKMYAWAGDPPATDVFLKAGLKPVTVASTDVLMGLQTGMLNAFPGTPLSALSLQWFGLAKNMLEVRWSPFVGATIIDNRTWNKVPAELQPTLLEIARRHGRALAKEVRALDQAAIPEMKKYGLSVVAPADLEEWKKFAESFYPLLRGTVMEATALDQVLSLHKAYQAGRKTP